MLADATLAELSCALQDGATTSRELTEEALERIRADEQGRLTFTQVFAESARIQADAMDRLRAAGVMPSPLAGIPVSVKDLFDVQGQETRAGSVALSGCGPATGDATAVARLRAAGAVIVGHTNMTEFAFSGVGLNPHYGTPGNPHDRRRIPGGSSSGAAVSVGEGMVAAAVGTDTGGSVRIPSTLCGLAGFKPTQRRIDLRGTVPLSTTLDSIGPLARSVACCAMMDSILAGEEATPLDDLPLAGLRFAVPLTYVMDGLDAPTAEAFAAALRTLSRAGAHIVEQPFDNLGAIPRLLESGGLAAAESYAWHRGRLAEKGDLYDPRVRARMERGAALSAADYIDLLTERRRQIAEMDRRMAPFDAVLCPTTAIVAPRFDDFTDDETYTRLNLTLLRNTTVGNLLDLCAATVPCAPRGALPVGLMVMGRSGTDRRTLAVAAAVEDALRH